MIYLFFFTGKISKIKLGKSRQSSALQSARELLTILTILVNSKDSWVLIIIMQWISCNLKAGFPDDFFSIGINFTKLICPQRENFASCFLCIFFFFLFFSSHSFSWQIKEWLDQKSSQDSWKTSILLANNCSIHLLGM